MIFFVYITPLHESKKESPTGKILSLTFLKFLNSSNLITPHSLTFPRGKVLFNPILQLDNYIRQGNLTFDIQLQAS